MSAWPASVWRSPWLRGLPPGARPTLEAAGRLRSLARGERLFSPGEPADAFFVVGEGLVEVRAVRRGEAASSAIRRAMAGDAIGQDALAGPGAARAGEATCVDRAVVVEVPAGVFRREVERAGGAAAELPRQLRRAAAADVLRASSLARALGDGPLRALLAALEPGLGVPVAPGVAVRELSRGEILFAAGEPASFAFVVGEGMLAAERDGGAGARPVAYLQAGDLLGAVALRPGGAHAVTVRACGPAWGIALPACALRDEGVTAAQLEGLERLRPAAPLPEATRHAPGDLFRFAEAGSMLVIDDETCARCGHCAWTCADVHDDGVSRLHRRGEKVRVRDATDGSARALLVPGGCQHCKHPACMIDCPTGAIGRDPGGAVFVREELCVGCGQCARACPWGSVQMAPRPVDARRRLPLAGAGPEIAVKCDGCRGREGGPACVQACPAGAMARVEPVAAMMDVRRALGARGRGAPLPSRAPAWPWVVGAAALALAAARVPAPGFSGRLATGAAALGIAAALAGYALAKRGRLPLGPIALRGRALATCHQALGVLGVGVVLAHSGGHVRPDAAGALLVAFAVASATGALAGLVQALLPRALSRVESSARLLEDLPGRPTELGERAFGALTGRSDATKDAYARSLAPYARAPLGGLALLASGRSLGQERARLEERARSAAGARAGDLDGLGELARLAVEMRAVGAQRALQGALRAVVPAHVVAVGVAVALLVVHVALVARGR